MATQRSINERIYIISNICSLFLKDFGSHGIKHIIINPVKEELIASSSYLTQIFDLRKSDVPLQKLPNEGCPINTFSILSSKNKPSHNDKIRQVIIDSTGKYLATRGKTIKIWQREK